MGLLDILGTSWDDPKTMAALQLAGGLLGGQGNTMQRLAGGLNAYGATMSAAKKAQQEEEERRQKMALVAAQVAETQAQAEQRRALAQEAARKAQQDEAVRRLLVGQLTPTQPIEANAVSGITGPRPEALAAVGAPRRIDAQALVAQGVPVEQVKALMESPNYGRVEVSRTVQGKDAQGRPVTFQFDKFGQQVGKPIEDWKDQQTVDFGGQIYLRDPITNRLTKLGDKTQTPDSRATNSLGYARLAQELNLANQGVTYQQDSNGNFVALPTKAAPGSVVRATPVAAPGGGMTPLQGKVPEMTDAQAKANLFGTRAQEADAVINKMAASGVNRSGDMKRGADAIPLIGGAAGSLLNWTQSAPEQQVEQAQRDFINAVLRRESGAVISPDEFDNARKQYFPQVGDSSEVIEQKAKNRRTAVQGILVEVPANRRSAPPTGPQPTLRWNPSTGKLEPTGG